MKVTVDNEKLKKIKNDTGITIDMLSDLTRIARPTVVRLIYIDSPKTEELYLKAIIEAINKFCGTNHKVEEIIKGS